MYIIILIIAPKKYLNMYKKETNIFKEDIAFLYNIKNGKNL